MRTGVFLFGGVEFPDAGAGPPAPMDRRFGHKEMWRATERIIDMGVVCDRLGFDSYWLTEHHFQHEGYEVVPNGILVGTILAERTENIRIGMAFNIVPQWHPLRPGRGLRHDAQHLRGPRHPGRGPGDGAP